MKTEIKVTNINKVLASFQKLNVTMLPDLQEVIKGGAQTIRTEAVNLIQKGAKSGKVYRKYNPTREHVSSAPGQAPASDTGNLVRNIKVVQVNQDVTQVTSEAKYSKELEYGTSKMRARPFMFPAYKMSQDKILKATFLRVVKVIEGIV